MSIMLLSCYYVIIFVITTILHVFYVLSMYAYSFANVVNCIYYYNNDNYNNNNIFEYF